MGLSSKKVKTRQTNRPVYDAEIGGAARAQQAAYDRQLPAINEFSDNLGSISGDLFERYREGDPTINAAQDWAQGILALDPGSNPHLDGMIELANDNTRRDIQTRLGTRGGIGGSSERDILANALAEQELRLRYQDYDATLGRQAQAAGMSPSLVAGGLIPLEAAARYGEAGAMLPLDAALRNSAGVGGLLGQFQNVEGEQKKSGGFFGDLLLSAISGAGSYFGGGK